MMDNRSTTDLANRTATNQHLNSSNPALIETRLENAKDKIQRDVDELSSRLSPTALKEQIQEGLTEAQDVVVETVHQLTNSVGAQAQQLSSSLAENVKKSPWAGALMGLGIGLVVAGGIVASSKTSQDDTSANAAKPSTTPSGQAFSAKAPQSASNVLEKSIETSPKSSTKLTRWLDEQPLLVGGVSLVTGAVLGLLVPKTSYENEVLGESRNAVIDQAKTKVHDVVEVAKETIHQAASSLQEELKDRNLSTEGIGKSVRSLVEETKAVSQKAFDDAKETLKSEAKKRDLISNSETDTSS